MNAEPEQNQKPRRTRRTGKKVRLVSLKDLDGRTIAGMEAKKLVSAIVADLGGEANLSTLELKLAEHAAWDAARLGDLNARWALGKEEIAVTEIATVENCFNRTALLRTKRTTRDITPSITEIVANHRKASATDVE